MQDVTPKDEAFVEEEGGTRLGSPFSTQPGELSGLRPPSGRLPSFTPFLVVACVLVAVWAFLFFTAPKDMKPQHLHICETQGPDNHRALCFH